METVLVVGASGNIGISTILAARNTGRNVMAVVRNAAAQDKIVRHVGSRDGITFVQADVTQADGLKRVLEQVKTGRLPDFQHVYAAVGTLNCEKVSTMDIETFHQVMRLSCEANIYAYNATFQYLIEQGKPNSTWTIITGGLGDLGIGGAVSIAQGALFAFAGVGAYECMRTNVRFNEVYLALQVAVDDVAVKNKLVKASRFAQVYERILDRKDLKSARVYVENERDIDHLRFEKKLPDSPLVKMALDGDLHL
ncbi:uncharacterized protein UV8b_00045 [Ustilaginoidea virens]|uniref:Short-chain dehydrogenase n=1 Tax=Ustilaginoidea virens TaxID=1159556 RepID=A0A8E5HI38_USTVR|nr:uncharacterized protein UV8b_00045 [Ustilaginoidea virens]QUC15804.1 hypothetical protein UV8b_00045 [Ustilaginoidea virens]